MLIVPVLLIKILLAQPSEHKVQLSGCIRYFSDQKDLTPVGCYVWHFLLYLEVSQFVELVLFVKGSHLVQNHLDHEHTTCLALLYDPLHNNIYPSSSFLKISSNLAKAFQATWLA